MKKGILSAVVVAILLILGFLFYQQYAIRRNLPGNWVTTGPGFYSTFTIASNGDYVCQVMESNGTPGNRLEGNMRVEKGFLIQTITNTTQTNVTLPVTTRTLIARGDGNTLVLKHEGGVASVLRKSAQ